MDSDALIMPLLNTVGSILESDAPSSLKIEAAQTLVHFGSGYGQRHLETDSQIEETTPQKSLATSTGLAQSVKSQSTLLPLSPTSKSSLSPTSKSTLKGSSRGGSLLSKQQTILGESGAVEAAVKGFEHSLLIGANDVSNAIGEALLEMSFCIQSAERMHEGRPYPLVKESCQCQPFTDSHHRTD